MSVEERVNVPPDGGWGWIIVVAFALNGVATVPIIQGFGLIFKDTFPLLGFSATDGAVIINTNLAFGMILGLVNGPLLRNYGYRKVATVGTLIYTIGVTLTAFARSFPVIVMSYGIFASIGVGLTMSAFSFALNSYFTKKRGRAMGLALTITGLGPIVMPQITSYLISFYGFQGTILLYGSFTLHSLVGAALLHPVRWHLKHAENASSLDVAEESIAKQTEGRSVDDRKCSFDETASAQHSTQNLDRWERRRRITVSSIDHDIEVGSIYGFDTPLPRQLSETVQSVSWDKNIDAYFAPETVASSITSLRNETPDDYSRWNSHKTVATVNLGSGLKLFDEELPNVVKGYSGLSVSNDQSQDFHCAPENDTLLQKNVEEMLTNVKNNFGKKREEKSQEASITLSMFKRIADFYDLGLLRDPIYVNIMMGMSIAIFAEINFSLLTPFILSDMNLSTKQIATVMSVVATVDLVFRSAAPYLGEWLRQPPRTMYLISLILLIIGRTCLIFVNGSMAMLLVASGLGAAKGIRSVYMSLVLPSYVPIDRLPYASGIQMVTNGVILMCFGPVLGVVRDSSGSYASCIMVMNCITAITVGLWLTEMYIVRRRKIKTRLQPRQIS